MEATRVDLTTRLLSPPDLTDNQSLDPAGRKLRQINNGAIRPNLDLAIATGPNHEYVRWLDEADGFISSH